MPKRIRSGEARKSRAQSVSFAILLALFAVCCLGGGASRGDVLSLLYVRPAAILAIAALLLVSTERDWRSFRALLWMLGGFAAIMALQLVPMPASWWLALPGRQAFEPAVSAAGAAQPWRALSLTPDRTFQSMLTLLFPLAAIVALATLEPERGRQLLPVMLGAIVLSATLGVLQLTDGERSSFHFYTVTHRGSAVGLFANRNHQAALLAMAIPMLRIWTVIPDATGPSRRVREGLALSLAVFLIAMILVTGSRAGLALGLLGIAVAAVIAPWPAGQRVSPRKRWLAVLAVVATPLVIAGGVFALGRANALQRIIASGASDPEIRFEYMPLMLRIVYDFLPFGTGFGSFDPVFRMYEPDAVLGPQFFNHAHNELFELAITGGAFALLLVALFIVWFARASYAILQRKTTSTSALYGRLGATMILFLLLASIVDYPLRTPLMAFVFGIAAGWLAQALRPRSRR